METPILQNSDGHEIEDRALLRRFSHAVEEALGKHDGPIVSSTATELFGAALVSELGESHVTLVRLLGASGELLGVLCLGDPKQALTDEDEKILQAIAGHAAVALENARLFTRMEQANRHWVEIFDAIGDFIVAHDGADNITRVNRSLADFIGVPPRELIGVNMCALLAMDDAAPRSCPFCRGAIEGKTNMSIQCSAALSWFPLHRHGADSEDMRTIHVLKDITDRREAERRYRELFDNIQEGLVFLHSGRPIYRG